MDKNEYEAECKAARNIAGSEPSVDAHVAVADAVLLHKDTIIMRKENGRYVMEVEYMNEFGPTCGVDDVIERMTMVDWRMFCAALVVKLLQGICGKKQSVHKNDFLPTVSFTPELHDDIINCVNVVFAMPKAAYTRLLKVVNKEQTK